MSEHKYQRFSSRPGLLLSVLALQWVPAISGASLVSRRKPTATVYAPDNWYNPFDPFSVMTCLAQWGTAMAILLLLNRWLVARTGGKT